MKYITGLLGIVWACSSVWAVPETMQMYATLSAPIGSFWEIKTASCEPVVMPANSQLNFGFVSATGDVSSVYSKGGSMALLGTKPLSIKKLRMEKDTTFSIGASSSNPTKWLVNTLKIAPSGSAAFNGDLIVNILKLDENYKLSSNATLTVSSVLRLGNNITTSDAKFTVINTNNGESCSSGDFCFQDTNGPSSANWQTIDCTKNELSTCPKTYKLLFGTF